MLDLEPPMFIALPTDEQRALRRDCARRGDHRALPIPEGGMAVVERMERSDESALQPIYVRAIDVQVVRLAAAVVKAGSMLWLDFGFVPQESPHFLVGLRLVEIPGQIMRMSNRTHQRTHEASYRSR